MTKRTALLVVVGLAFAVGMLSQIRFQRRRDPIEPGPGFSFPRPDDIEQIEATVSLDVSGDATFVVPRSEYEKMLAAMSPSTRDTKPKKWVVLGELLIGTKDGESIRVSLYDTYAPIGAFSVGPYGSQVYYRGGNSPELRATLTKAKQTATADKDAGSRQFGP
jgi:hypothetical protein